MRLILLLLVGCSSEVDWSRKDAFRHCKDAIADYPERAAPPCNALHMCANEAVLTDTERAKLDKMVAASKCEPL